MAYKTADARQQLLDSIAQAIEQMASAIALLSEAYEQLDETSADRIEEQLFRPVQSAYGRAKRTHAEFAARHELPGREFEPAAALAPARGVKGFVDAAVRVITEADLTLATLQDSMLPVEVGDAQLRAGLEQVRSLLGDLRGRAHEFVRTLGR
ncbi:MAG TPA: hypothetical protein VFY36_12365 [Solirubrobacteraceae bacterium]|nr:hypothetical protein [Solirubrobacteraceae bacterium]